LKVETVEVESHRASYAKRGGEPDAHNGQVAKQEVQAAAVVEKERTGRQRRPK